MRASLEKLGLMAIILSGIALVSCSGPPSEDVIQSLVLQSHPDIRELEIVKVGEYDSERNRLTVRARYQWTPHSAWREEVVTDFVFFKDVGSEEWKLHPSAMTISRKFIP